MLSHTEMPTSLQAAEEAIKKHEDFLTTTEASEEKITGVVEAGRRLINDANANADKIQEKVDSVQDRSEPNVGDKKRKLCKDFLSFEMFEGYVFDFLLIFSRHHKNKEAANELLTKLKDNCELQHFLQDGQEVTAVFNQLVIINKQSKSINYLIYFSVAGNGIFR